MRWLGHLLAACVLFSVVTASADWTESSFKDFVDGTFDDGGVNCYVSAAGRIQLINRWDFNGDGYIDLLFPSSHNPSDIVDAFAYLGGQDGLRPERMLRLPSNGGEFLATADLNHDGSVDVVIGNGANGTNRKTNVFIYWGGRDGHPERRRTVLPAHNIRSLTVGDFNGDGWEDLVVLSSLTRASDPGTPGSRCFWGGEYGFALERSEELDWAASRTCIAADFNADGFDDLAVGGRGGVMLYWGADSELSQGRSDLLPLSGVRKLRTGDVNADGCIDLIACRSGDESTILLGGGGEGLSVDRALSVPVRSPVDCAVGDLNGDGRPDLAFAAAIPMADGRASVVLLGGDKGFGESGRVLLPTYSASGVAVGDVNGDGIDDVAFANRLHEQVYDIESPVYPGGPNGPSPQQCVLLPTSGATAVDITDVNSDGTNDVLFVNGTAYDLLPDPADLYWGDASGTYSVNRYTALPACGGYGSTMADFNDDGYVDVLIDNCEAEGGEQKTVGSFLYWGAADGLDPKRRAIVPTRQSMGSCAADLNRDGYLDLFVTCVEGNNKIFWGSAEGFSASRTTELQSPDPSLKQWRFGQIADLNRDGYLDLIAPECFQPFSLIWWGGPDGYTVERTSKLPDRYAVASEVADLNADGYLDLILGNFWEPRMGNQHYTFSYIYWGAEGGYSPFNRTEVPTVGADDASVADLNRDGFLDIFISNYHNDTDRMLDSYIYWGNANAEYGVQNRQRLYQDSAAGNLIADVNGDGWMDLIVANHRRLGDHNCQSRIFYGGPHGFNTGNMALVPTHGCHSMVTTDVGHIYHRRLEWIYTSSVHDTGGRPDYKSLSWKADTPHGTGVKIQLRSAATRKRLEHARWRGPDGRDSWYTRSGEPIPHIHDGHRWVQYRVMLTTPNGGPSPVLTSVTVAYTLP